MRLGVSAPVTNIGRVNNQTRLSSGVIPNHIKLNVILGCQIFISWVVHREIARQYQRVGSKASRMVVEHCMNDNQVIHRM